MLPLFNDGLFDGLRDIVIPSRALLAWPDNLFHINVRQQDSGEGIRASVWYPLCDGTTVAVYLSQDEARKAGEILAVRMPLWIMLNQRVKYIMT